MAFVSNFSHSFVRCVACSVRAQTPRLRTFASATALPPTQSSSSTQSQAGPSRLVEQRIDASASDEASPQNLIFEDGEIDVTDEVLAMLERDNAFKSALHGPSSATDLTYLPLSSLASPNPTLPASSNLAIPLPPKVFSQPLRRDILHRCVVYYLSLLRQGSGSTKTRAEVNYSGRKLRKQKGSGKARVGDAGSGTRRGGGTIHGPHPRSFAQALPRKVQQLGLHVALSTKLKSGLLRVVESLGEGNWGKTRDARIALSDVNPKALEMGGSLFEESEEDLLAIEGEDSQQAPLTVADITKFGPSNDLSILFVYSQPTTVEARNFLVEFDRVTRNIPGIDVLCIDNLQTYEVLKRKWVVMDLGSVEVLAERAGQSEVFGIAEELLEGEEGVEGEVPVELLPEEGEELVVKA